MDPLDRHRQSPHVSFDGGDLDCGNGLLLLIRKHIDPLEPGQLLEIISTDSSVETDLPSWCRMTRNELVSWTKSGKTRSYLVSKGPGKDSSAFSSKHLEPASIADAAQTTTRKPMSTMSPVPPLAVMGVGSWPRPQWMLKTLHGYIEGKTSAQEFQDAANDAVRLCVDAQLEAGVDVITDGEQRRDNYSSFVAMHLENCQLIPLVDLLPLVDDPVKFEAEMNSLDVPAAEVRHPAVFGKLARKGGIAGPELEYLKTITDRPVKIALPGPYLLTRTMWMECISDRAYQTREELATDIVRVLNEEIKDLLSAGCAVVQLDEPVLTEIVFGDKSGTGGRTFMCGALSERKEEAAELEFATELLNQAVNGIDRDRLALHVCRGNWTPDESVALSGDYRPLLPLFNKVNVGTLFLEFCTERAGGLEILKDIDQTKRIGLGSVNQKSPLLESVEHVVEHVRRAISLVGKERLWLNPDCGFATFADNPITGRQFAVEKLKVLVQAKEILS